MPRLPQPGGDTGEWGQILNEYLSAAHKTDGTLKDNIINSNNLAAGAVTASSIEIGSITESNLDSTIINKINAVAGQVGATGPTGPAGATGAAGQVGATGVTGPAGTDGTSVNIAGSVASSANLPTLSAGDVGSGYLTENDGHLYVWSGSSWTDVGEIRGPQGATGPQGAIGASGATGAQGTTGLQGSTGTQGSTGATGSIGLSGATGSTGPQGATGATGPAGATTISGISGLQAALDGKVAGYNGLIGIWRGSQAEYDAITTKNNAVLYVINGE